MQMAFRWYGEQDPIPLAHIRQIPGVHGIVCALYEVPVGDVWPQAALEALRERVEAAGLRLRVIESIPVHEDIKLGRPTRDRLIEHYQRSLEHVATIGVPVVCYNFMPVFDWFRTDLAMQLPDDSTALSYEHEALAAFDLSRGAAGLPGWATAYTPEELNALRAAYRRVDAERLWDHLAYFLERIVPVAEACGVRLALHPDDPPWSIFDLPRIITSGAALQRVVELVDSPANGITLCTGSLGADPANDLPALVRQLGAQGRLHFVHLRNVRVTGDRQFHESPHPDGSLDLYAVVDALQAVGFDGPARPDHGRMIWGEAGRPGYGLYDRALGAMYLQGLWEACARS